MDDGYFEKNGVERYVGGRYSIVSSVAKGFNTESRYSPRQ